LSDSKKREVLSGYSLTTDEKVKEARKEANHWIRDH